MYRVYYIYIYIFFFNYFWNSYLSKFKPLLILDRIKALRQQNEDKKYNNIACMRLNAMKYLPNLFYKGQVR